MFGKREDATDFPRCLAARHPSQALAFARRQRWRAATGRIALNEAPHGFMHMGSKHDASMRRPHMCARIADVMRWPRVVACIVTPLRLCMMLCRWTEATRGASRRRQTQCPRCPRWREDRIRDAEAQPGGALFIEQLSGLGGRVQPRRPFDRCELPRGEQEDGVDGVVALCVITLLPLTGQIAEAWCCEAAIGQCEVAAIAEVALAQRAAKRKEQRVKNVEAGGVSQGAQTVGKRAGRERARGSHGKAM